MRYEIKLEISQSLLAGSKLFRKEEEKKRKSKDEEKNLHCAFESFLPISFDEESFL